MMLGFKKGFREDMPEHCEDFARSIPIWRLCKPDKIEVIAVCYF